MHATSTPTLAQPRPGAFGAVVAATTLAVGLAIGALIGTQLAVPAAGPAALSGQAITAGSLALQGQRNGETGALSPAQRALLAQRQGEITAGSIARPATDPMSYFNGLPLGVAPSTLNGAPGAAGWTAISPSVKVSAFLHYADVRRQMAGRSAVAIDRTWLYLGYADLQRQGGATGDTQQVGVAHR